LTAALEHQVKAAKAQGSPSQDTLQTLSVSLAKITKALVDATGLIPSYDQKQHENVCRVFLFYARAQTYLVVSQQLKTLEASIESLRTSVPKSKFAFTRKLQVQPELRETPAPAHSATSPSSKVSSTSSFSVVLSSQSNKYLTRESFCNYSEPSNLVISDLDTCVVDLVSPSPNFDTTSTTSNDAPKISALHGRSLRNCVLLLPSIEGSALFHDLEHCTIVLACHQVGHYWASAIRRQCR